MQWVVKDTYTSRPYYLYGPRAERAWLTSVYSHAKKMMDGVVLSSRPHSQRNTWIISSERGGERHIGWCRR